MSTNNLPANNTNQNSSSPLEIAIHNLTQPEALKVIGLFCGGIYTLKQIFRFRYLARLSWKDWMLELVPPELNQSQSKLS